MCERVGEHVGVTWKCECVRGEYVYALTIQNIECHRATNEYDRLSNRWRKTSWSSLSKWFVKWKQAWSTFHQQDSFQSQRTLFCSTWADHVTTWPWRTLRITKKVLDNCWISCQAPSRTTSWRRLSWSLTVPRKWTSFSSSGCPWSRTRSRERLSRPRGTSAQANLEDCWFWNSCYRSCHILIIRFMPNDYTWKN